MEMERFLYSAYPIEDRTRDINIVYDEAVIEFLKADPNWKFDDFNYSNLNIIYRDLESGKTHYTVPDSLLVFQMVRIKDKNGDWKTLDPVFRKELTSDELNSVGEPEKYYKIGNSVFPIPLPDYGISNGI
jgi:hypothetical protein